MQKGRDQREKVTRHLLIALRRGVDAVGLHAAGNAIDVLEQKRQQRHMILPGQESVGFVELPDVVRAIVGRKCDAAQHHLDARMLERRDNAIEIAARALDGKTTQAIVAAKRNDGERGFESEHIIEAVNAIFGRVAADAGVDDVIGKAFRVEVFLQKIRVAVAAVGSVAGGEAIAERDDDRAGISCRSGLGRGSSRRSWSGWFRRRTIAIASTERERRSKRKNHAGTARAHHTFNLTVERKPNEGARGDRAA